MKPFSASQYSRPRVFAFFAVANLWVEVAYGLRDCVILTSGWLLVVVFQASIQIEMRWIMLRHTLCDGF
jgi:hypothetical protein